MNRTRIIRYLVSVIDGLLELGKGLSYKNDVAKEHFWPWFKIQSPLCSRSTPDTFVCLSAMLPSTTVFLLHKHWCPTVNHVILYLLLWYSISRANIHSLFFYFYHLCRVLILYLFKGLFSAVVMFLQRYTAKFWCLWECGPLGWQCMQSVRETESGGQAAAVLGLPTGAKRFCSLPFFVSSISNTSRPHSADRYTHQQAWDVRVSEELDSKWDIEREVWYGNAVS